MRKKELIQRLAERDELIRDYYRSNTRLKNELLKALAENGRLLSRLQRALAAISGEE